MAKDKLNGFTVLTVNYSKDAQHNLYIKLHQTSTQGARSDSGAFPPGRTLFVVNLPPDATSRELSLLFKPPGAIERVLFSTGVGAEDDQPDEELNKKEAEGQSDESDDEGLDSQHTPKKRRVSQEKVEKQPAGPPKIVPLPPPTIRHYRHSGYTAHIVFLDESSLTRALALPNTAKEKSLSWPSSSEPRGVRHYLALHAHLRPPLSAVKEHADSSLEAYEYIRANTKVSLIAAASKYKKGEPIVDEEGFTLVTRAGTHGQTLGGGVGVASKSFELNMRKGGQGDLQHQAKSKKKEKEGFYTFQVREKKRKEFMNLRQKFEEDKAKVAKLKEKRKFKPY